MLSSPFDMLKAIAKERPGDVSTAIIDLKNVDDDLVHALLTVFDPDMAESPDALALEKRIRNGELPGIDEAINDIFVSLDEMDQNDTERVNARKEDEKKRANWRADMEERGVRPEAPEGAPLGFFAFPDDRLEDLPTEPDTETETKLLNVIYSHLKYSGEIPEHLAEVISQILDNGWYPKIFKRAKVGSTIYRGMHVPGSWLKGTIGDAVTNKKGEFSAGMTFTPYAGKYSTSWTIAKSVAISWSSTGTGAYANQFSVVLTAKVSKDLLALDANPMYARLPELRRYNHEQEVICFGPVKCHTVSWEPGSRDTRLESVIRERSEKVRRGFSELRGQPVEIPAGFEGSKLIDSGGNPIVFYHGSRSDFQRFSKKFLNLSGTGISTNYLGFFFTSSPEVAGIYVSKHYDPKLGRKPGGHVNSYVLDVEKPYFITERTYWKWGHGSGSEMEDLVVKLQSHGYDAIVMPSVWRGRGQGSFDVVVFDDSQIQRVQA